MKPLSHQTDSYHAYQQALCDFGVTELMEKLSNFSDPDFDSQWMNLEQQELESLTKILIQYLSDHFQGKLIASYLNAIRYGDFSVQTYPINLEIPSHSIDLPANFPNVKIPRFIYGDKLRWISLTGNTEWGVVIGRFYSFAPHCYCWMWRYLLWLDKDSSNAPWQVTDIAWEKDLEPLALEV